MNKVYTKFLLQWVTNVVVAVTVEMVYVTEHSKVMNTFEQSSSSPSSCSIYNAHITTVIGALITGRTVRSLENVCNT